MKKSEIIRVVGCQGSIQLITATNVLLNRPAIKDVTYKNHLLIYELYSPNGQDISFFQFLEKMARSGPIKFDRIIYLKPDILADLQACYQAGGLSAARHAMSAVTETLQADELYLTSNWHPGNQLVMHCVPSVTTICYGDSIGLFIPEGYFESKTTFSALRKNKIVRRLTQALKSVIAYIKQPARRPAFKILRPIKFSIGYFLTLELSKEKPSCPVVSTSRSSLIKTFTEYLPSVSSNFDEDPLLQNGKLVFVLTTNFSEAKKMTLENEIEAYVDYLGRHVEKGAVIIVKPHPRDSQFKLQLLKKALADEYSVKILDGPHDFFVPFELFLLMLRQKTKGLTKMEFHTFSSACLSLKILFQENPEIGMGTSLVNKYFEPQHRTPRIEHEKDLRRLMTLPFE